MSFVTAIYHVVINTYRRRLTIPNESSEKLYRYIFGIVKAKGCTLLRVNGIGNHIHLLIELSPATSLSSLMQDVKSSSSKWMKQYPQLFPMFEGWGKEYAAFTYALRDKDMLIHYIDNQRIHHQSKSFEHEYRVLMRNAGIEWNEKFMLT